MLAEIIKGRPLEEARRIAELVRKMLKGEDVELPEDLGDIDDIVTLVAITRERHIHVTHLQVT